MAQDTTGQIQEFLDVLRKRRWLITIPALFVTSLGVAFAVVIPKKYEILTEIEIRESRIESDNRLRDPNENATKIELQNAREHIQNWRRIKDIIEDDSALWAEYFALSEVERDKYITRVKQNVSVDVREKKRDRGSTFIDIVYTDVDGDRGEAFLGELTDRWIHEVVDRDRQTLIKEKQLLQDELKNATSSFNDANEALFSLAKDMGIDASLYLEGGRSFGPATGDPRYLEAVELESSVEELRAEEAGAEARIQALRDTLALEPMLIPTEVRAEGEDNSREVEFLRIQIEQARELQAGKTPQNSQWRLLEQEIEDLEEQIAELMDLQYEPVLQEISSPNPERQRIQNEIERETVVLEGIKAQLQTGEDRLDRLLAENNRLTSDWQEFFMRRNERDRFKSALDEASQSLRDKELAIAILNDAYGQPYDILRPPKATPEPVEPNPLLIVTVAVIAGIALGLFLAVSIEFMPNSYRTTGEVARVLGVPVLGAVGMIVTRAERRKAAVRSTMVGMSSAVILAGMGWFIYTLAFKQETLPTDVQKVIEDLQLMLM